MPWNNQVYGSSYVEHHLNIFIYQKIQNNIKSDRNCIFFRTHRSVRLHFGCDVLIHFQTSVKNYAARKRVFSSLNSPFRHFITSIHGWIKRKNPPDISVVGVHEFTKFRIPPPLSFEIKTISRIFPCPGA